ncbi:HIT domain-containing protein [Candidatus Paracaedibacter symbiosus]|uniref:HIT domain-containing protein n=1 Tax=Candidatus Paracaedibacter symbiosus TaxID=244582 RepID=UPI000509661E|nr:HIT family protein [Candidatus Paracaedibacter symbiosus]
MWLDPRLEASSSFIIDLELCQVRLSHNAAFPWILLIPKGNDIVEIIDLNMVEQQLLMQEIALASHVMRSLFSPHKLNVASLGNVVSQLHVHIIARFDNDSTWPYPVWNTVSEAYPPSKQNELIAQLKAAFTTID